MTSKVEYVEDGVANVFDDGIIEMHKDLQLPQNKKLHDDILAHELEHDHKKGFVHNFKVDLFNKASTVEILKFMAFRPSTWVQIAPFYWSRRHKQLIYDLNLIIFWGIIAFAIILVANIIL